MNHCAADECGEEGVDMMSAWVVLEDLEVNWATVNESPCAYIPYRHIMPYADAPMDNRISLWSAPMPPQYEKETIHEVQSFPPDFGIKVIG